MDNRKVILYIAMSLDGYIATKDDNLDFLSLVEKEGEDYGYSEFTKNIDTYIVGKKTYDVVRKLTGGDFPPAKDFKCYVITRQQLEPSGNVTFFNGDAAGLVRELKMKPGKDIYCDGGTQIVKLLLNHNLIDEFIVSIIPVLLGNGKKLFLEDIPFTKLKLKASKSFSTGLVQVHYTKQDVE